MTCAVSVHTNAHVVNFCLCIGSSKISTTLIRQRLQYGDG